MVIYFMVGDGFVACILASFIIASHRGVTQASFSITVRDVDGDMVVWESGEVNSQEKTHIVYGSVGNKVCWTFEYMI